MSMLLKIREEKLRDGHDQTLLRRLLFLPLLLLLLLIIFIMGDVVPSWWRCPLAVALASAVLLLDIAHAQAQSNPSVDKTTTTSFSFPSFPLGSCGAGGSLSCMHSSTVRNGYIAVTRDDEEGDPNLLVDNIGRVLYRRPVIEWPASFTTSFTVRIVKGANATGFGDGMSFVMTGDMRGSPPRSYGGFLGLFDQATTGNTTGQLAVEIDTYQNEFDPDSNHVGVDIATIVSNTTGPLSDVGVDPKTGRPVTFRIQYDGWSKNLEVSAGYAGEGPLRSVLNYTLVIARMRNPPVYVGFTGGTGPSIAYREAHRVLSWNFSSTTLPAWSLDEPRDKKKSSSNEGTTLAIVLSVVLGLPLLGLLVFLGVRRVRAWKRRRQLEAMSRSAVNAPKMYTYSQLARATRHFSSANLLGKGGFGSVYRGYLSNPPAVVAVKKMSATSKQGEREYFAEICTIGRLRHRNLVQLQGWCHSGKSLLLVYQFMPNGSLDRHIASGTLDWPTRHRILLGLASALLYLHEECGGTVVHRDVKPNNVLLDAEFDAHLGDFGLARLLQSADRTTTTTILAGTIGYLAPECGYTGKSTPETDVFSYGVVVLEVICGRRSLLGYDDKNLLDHVWDLYTADELLQAVDPRLEGQFDEEQVTRALLAGLMCAHPGPAYRPKIRKVVNILDNPNEPLMEMPASRPDTIVASPMMMGRGAVEGLTSIMTTSTMLPPPESSPDNTSTSVLIAR